MSPSWFSYQLRSISCSTFFCLRATYSLVMSPISLSTSSSYIYYSSPYIMSCAISFIIDIFYFYVINLFIVSWKFLFPIFWLAPCIILAIPSITFFIDQLTVICCNLNIKELITRMQHFVIGRPIYHIFQSFAVASIFVVLLLFEMPK